RPRRRRRSKSPSSTRRRCRRGSARSRPSRRSRNSSKGPRVRRLRVLVPALFLLASLAPALAAAEGEDRKLRALFDEAWAFRLAEDPLFATSAGEHRYDDKLPSMTHADLERRAAYARSALERLKGIDRAALSPSDGVSADMFARELSDALADFEFGACRIPINADSGFPAVFGDLPERM